MKTELASQIVEKTKKDYDQIAQAYSKTERPAVWHDHKIFTTYLSQKNTVLDLGCGDGRLAELLRPYHVSYHGIDISPAMIQIAQKNAKPEEHFRLMSHLNIPYPRDYFNTIYCIGMLHHIPSKKFRLDLLQEIKRTLKPQGYLVMTNWNLWKPPHLSSVISQNIKKAFNLSSLDFNDIHVPWKKDQSKPIQRYYHAFTRGETAGLIHSANFKLIKNEFTTYKDSPNNNILTVAQKQTLKPQPIKENSPQISLTT